MNLFSSSSAKHVLQVFIQELLRFEIKRITGNILICVIFAMAQRDIIVKEITGKIILGILGHLDALWKEVEMSHLLR